MEDVNPCTGHLYIRQTESNFTMIRSFRRAFNEVVPQQNVLLRGVGVDVRRRRLLYRLIFLGQLYTLAIPTTYSRGQARHQHTRLLLAFVAISVFGDTTQIVDGFGLRANFLSPALRTGVCPPQPRLGGKWARFGPSICILKKVDIKIGCLHSNFT
jgi:hypothetical protein